MLLRNVKTAIVGGGPGGLILARLLQLKDVPNVTVYERDVNRQARQQGATLDLHAESGLKALERANLMTQFQALHRPLAGRLRIVNRHGAIQMDDHDATTTSIDEERPEIDRAPLRDMLIDSLQPNSIAWNSQFVSMQPQDKGWNLQFKNGTTAYCDLVIAADGALSRLRPYITNVKAIYSGVTIVDGTIYNAAQNAPNLWNLTKGGKVFALGNEQTIILSAKGDGSLSFYTGSKEKEDWVDECGLDFDNPQQVYDDWFKIAFGSWDQHVWSELFTSGKSSRDNLWIVPRPQYHFPLDQTWTSLPNATMIGDATHRMPPYAGEGVNQALQDAYELAEYLTEDAHADIPTAIAAHEERMRQRSAEVTQDTLQSTELMHSKDGLEQLLQMFQELTGGGDDR